MGSWAKRSGHLLVEGTSEELVQRLLARPDIKLGLPNFEPVPRDEDDLGQEADQDASECETGELATGHDTSDEAGDDRMRLITTRGGFALWTPLGADADQDPAALPAMVDVHVRRLDGRCALTLRRRRHPRTSSSLASMITMGMFWVALAVLSPEFWIALAILPAFLVLPYMFVRHQQLAKTRHRRAWDALTETLAPLELPAHGDDTPFRRLPTRGGPDHETA